MTKSTLIFGNYYLKLAHQFLKKNRLCKTFLWRFFFFLRGLFLKDGTFRNLMTYLMLNGKKIKRNPAAKPFVRKTYI